MSSQTHFLSGDLFVFSVFVFKASGLSLTIDWGCHDSLSIPRSVSQSRGKLITTVCLSPTPCFFFSSSSFHLIWVVVDFCCLPHFPSSCAWVVSINNVTGSDRSHGLPALSRVWQHVQLSDFSLGTRPRYSQVVDEDFRNQKNKQTKALRFLLPVLVLWTKTKSVFWKRECIKSCKGNLIIELGYTFTFMLVGPQIESKY